MGLINAVFKSILATVIIIVTFDTSIFLYDLYNVYSKTNKVIDIIEKDVAEHNGLPEAMSEVYNGMLQDIIDKSYIADSFGTNFRTEFEGAESLAYDGDPSSGSEVVFYDNGDLIDIKVKIRLGFSLAIANFVTEDDERNTEEFTENGTSVINTDTSGYLFTRDIDFDRTVPALRYLK